MEIRDEDFGADLALVEGDDDICSSPETAPTCAPRDLRSLYERERARADGAEARCEELRRAEIDSRARASSLKWQLDTCRRKLSEAAEETKEVRRTAKDALSLQAEVARLEKLLSEAGVESSKRRRISSVSKERRRLRAALEQAENQKDKIKSLRTGSDSLRASPESSRLSRPLTLCSAPRGGEDHAGSMLPGTHIWSRREAPETSRRISPIWRFGRFVPVSRARRKGANSRKRAQRAATSFRTPAPDTGRCSTYPGSAPPGPGKAWRRPGRPLHLPSGPMCHDSPRWRFR